MSHSPESPQPSNERPDEHHSFLRRIGEMSLGKRLLVQGVLIGAMVNIGYVASEGFERADCTTPGIKQPLSSFDALYRLGYLTQPQVDIAQQLVEHTTC